MNRETQSVTWDCTGVLIITGSELLGFRPAYINTKVLYFKMWHSEEAYGFNAVFVRLLFSH